VVALAEKLNAALDAGGPELTQCLLDLRMLRRDGNRLVRTSIGEHALRCLKDPRNAP
jgi:hypothetical protein